MSAFVLAPVKVNLALHVGPPRRDGYHPVDTLCVFPAFGDVVGYDADAPTGLDLAGPFGHQLAGQDERDNLIWRAFRLLDVPPQGRFFLSKETPVASGIGAGTADGAAAMLLLNEVLGLGFREDQLVRRALGLGADGPVCMLGQIRGGGLIRARGIGERCDFLRRIEPQAMLLANPGVAVPTGRVFRDFDARDPAPLGPVSVGGSLAALHEENANDLAPPAMANEPSIEPLLSLMARQPGTHSAGMSGSGATCASLHSSMSSAQRAAQALLGRGFWAESAYLLPG
ncbi:4-(cytidine 5'-diphospho)-2-C-methyl-D-erythritol kinase [Parvularcula maris]|uniref:4-diphosphocytidyl-2-C-methyl-D-erythritol kinase n=1 Tax=Parvularcula maris TaxID=2965077 RepID=A0A9X2L8K0_9PROT|nr:4-(cytidine 5'-diphospho)-2-C-methyl-D-erythritol kinase [Parvularcula maris]